MEPSFTAEQILNLVGGAALRGDGSLRVTGMKGLSEAGPADLAFLGNPKYRGQVPGCRAGVILLPLDYPGSPPAGQAWVMVERPSRALAMLCEALDKALFPRPPTGVHPSAVVDPTAKVDPAASIGPLVSVGAGTEIGPGCVLEAGVVVGRHCRIGRDCHLYPKVVVYDRCVLGERVRLHSGVIIGADGFGYESVDGVHHKIPQIGTVVLEDDVEIGANTCVDRARFAETRIGAGTKIDNLVQVGHNVRVGPHGILVAQSGIAGSATLGHHVIVGGQGAIVGHIHIGDHAIVYGQSGVADDVPAETRVQGTPAVPAMQYRRLSVLTRRLPELFKRVAALESATPQSPPSKT